MDAILKQSGAIPFRFEAEGLRVLLITSRETGRWVIPKGNIPRGLTPAQAAEREAFEEAGVKGLIHKPPLGTYAYGKRLRSGLIRPALVTVYALEVRKQLKKWPERGERRLEWVTAPAAMDMVNEPGMAHLFLQLAELQLVTSS